MVLETFVWKDWRDLCLPSPPYHEHPYLIVSFCIVTQGKYKVNGNMGHAVLFPLSYQHVFLP